jgi:hypothetical protein
MQCHLQSGVPNANGDTFDLPYEVVNGVGTVVEAGVFKGCRVTHVSRPEYEGSNMESEPALQLLDRVMPFTTDEEGSPK